MKYRKFNHRFHESSDGSSISTALSNLKSTASGIVRYQTDDFYDADAVYEACVDMQGAIVKVLAGLGYDVDQRDPFGNDFVNSFDYAHDIKVNFDDYIEKYETLGKVVVVKLLCAYSDILDGMGESDCADRIFGMIASFK